MEHDLFTRLTSVHKPDCELFEGAVVPMASPDPDELAATLGTEAAARYAEACRPVYEDLRRIVGQISGMMILAQLTRRSEVADLKELTGCRERWQQAADRLNALRVPSQLTVHYDQLMGAHTFSGMALSGFAGLSASGENDAIFDEISRHVQRAYAHLRSATAEKAGLHMVDLDHACCSCGRS